MNRSTAYDRLVKEINSHDEANQRDSHENRTAESLINSLYSTPLYDDCPARSCKLDDDDGKCTILERDQGSFNFE